MNVREAATSNSEQQTSFGIRKWRDLSLRSKFIILFVAMVVGFDLAFVLLWQPRANQFIVDLQSSEIQNELATAGEGMIPFLISNQVAAIHETLDVIKGRHKNWIVLVFKDAEGNRIYPLAPPPDLGLQNLVEIEEKVIFRGEHAATICAIVDFSEEQAVLRRYGYSMIAFATMIFVFAMLVIAVFFEILIGRRAAGIAKAAEGLAKGDFNTKLPRASGDEIGRLIQGFAEMREQVFSTQKSLSQAREEAELATQAKSQFLVIMSHEIRTPLNGMLGTLQLFEETKLSAKQREFLSIMNSSGHLLLHHVNDVLDLSRLDAGKEQIVSQTFDPRELASEVMESMRSVADSRGNELTLKTGNAPEISWGDTVRIKQVLYNLLSNANKFTKNGKIEIEVIQSKSAPYCSISVADTGIGIAEKDFDRVFSDFEQLDTSHIRRAGGTGLGLSISKRLVEAMGGNISIDSSPGRGSTFRFSWVSERSADTESAQTEIVPEPQSKTEAQALQPRGLDVLVVEDNHINRFVVREMLENEGHRVVEAINGKEGIEKAANHRYDLIFMDISMPEFDGIEVTNAIRNGGEASSVSPIVALTAHAMPEDIEAFKAVGMNDVLTKPISRPSLLEILKLVSLKNVESLTNRDGKETIDLPVLDQGHLEEISENIGIEKSVEFARSFIAEASIEIEKLASGGVNSGNMKAVASSCHKLAGSASMFGAARLRSVLVELEYAAKRDDTDFCNETLSKLIEVWNECRGKLREHFDL